MSTPDPYAALGVSETASAKEIKKAYRALAQKYHPDRNVGDSAAEDKFKEIQSAYDLIGDEEKRKAYDAERRNPFGSRGGPGGPFGAGQSGPYYRTDATGPGAQFDFGDGGLGDILGQMFGGNASQFGGARPASGARGGRDVDATMDLTFDEALKGGPSQITVPSGDTIRITIPQGVRNGLKIKLKGRGDAGPSGARGDLFITFAVGEHPRFTREKNDLRVVETVTAVEAMLGTRREIETPYGPRVKVKIPAGTQPGTALRVRGQGVKTSSGQGDLLVEVALSVPTLDEEAKESLRIWAETHDLV